MLTEVRPNAIAYCFTSSSYVLGPDGDVALKKRLETKSKGIPLTLTCLAATSALRALGVRRVAIIHPPWFAEDIEQRGAEYFQHQGFEVAYHARVPLRDTGEDIHPGPLYQWALANVPKQIEAVFFGGNGMRAVGIIQPLEEALGRPVLTSNQVCLWDSLRLANIPASVVGYGQLLERFTRG
jgi:maleate isomerase